jgi:hypothetical protein
VSIFVYRCDCGPEEMKREVEFRQRLEKTAVRGLRTPGGPNRRVLDSGGSAGAATSAAD